MFQYAFGYAAAGRINTDFVIDGSYSSYYPTSYDEPKQKYHLSKFGIPFSKEFDNRFLRISKNWLPASMIKKIYFCSHRITCRKYNLNRIADDLTLDQEHFQSIPDNSYLDGYFQYPKYFIAEATSIKKQFKFAQPPNIELDLEGVKSSKHSVGINLRRKEFLLPKNLLNQGICPLDYYEKSIRYVLTQFPNASLFVVSDDIRDSKKFLRPLEYDFTFLNENSNKHILSDMYLLMHCNHLILANSSYSWWSAFLNSHNHKIVIYPTKWVNNKKWQHFNETIGLKEWIRM